MRTAAELMSKIDQIALHNGNGYNNDILKEIEQFESKIRKDQDKITRHACAEISITTQIDYDGDSVTKLRNAIHQAIINTKAI